MFPPDCSLRGIGLWLWLLVWLWIYWDTRRRKKKYFESNRVLEWLRCRSTHDKHQRTHSFGILQPQHFLLERLDYPSAEMVSTFSTVSFVRVQPTGSSGWFTFGFAWCRVCKDLSLPRLKSQPVGSAWERFSVLPSHPEEGSWISIDPDHACFLSVRV